MIDMRNNGETYKAICDALNADKVPSKTKRKWQTMTVRRIIIGAKTRATAA